jgi:hypothetical protein
MARLCVILEQATAMAQQSTAHDACSHHHSSSASSSALVKRWFNA